MSILDKLRPQPEWKHADPEVRIAAVQQLHDEDADDVLAEIWRDDMDPRVRQAAVDQLADTQLLRAVVREDADEAVRATATATLLDLACSSDDPAVGRDALEGLTDPRDLADVARIASHEPIGQAALVRVTETKSLAAVARRSEHASVRLEALRRIQDFDELVAVALKSEHKDTALTALGRLTADPAAPEAAFEAIAARAKNKVTSRRAKAVLRDREAAGAQVAVDAPAPDERPALCARLEALAESDDWSAVTDGLREAELAWAELSPESSASQDDELSVRFGAAADALRTRLETHHRAQAERAREREAHAAAAGPRLVLCERVEHTDGESGAADIERARLDWAVLSGSDVLGEEEAAGLARRFEDGCAAALRRHARWGEIRDWRQRVSDALDQVDAHVAAGRLDEAASTWPATRKSWPALEGAWSDALRKRVEAIDAALKADKEEARTADTRRRRANLARLTQRCDQLEALVASDSITLKQAERGYRDTSAALDRPDQLPTKRDRSAINERMAKLQKALSTKLHELREIDSWKRWANVNVQESLCRRAEALSDVDDLAAVAKQLHECVAEWKLAATVPRERAGELWQRFKTAHDLAYARCSTFFAEQAAARVANLKQKTALCEQVEALAKSTDWVGTAKRIVELQAEWKVIGAVPRKQSKAIWKRFRGACDQFFDRRKVDLAQRKELWAKNYERKEALCLEAEALAESPDADAVGAVGRLQAEWRKVGPVKRSRSDAIWERFRTACAAVAERLAEKEEAALADKVAEREALCGELEALVPPEGDGPGEAPEGLAEKVKGVRQRWEKTGAVPIRRAKSLAFRFHEAVGKVVAAFPEAFRGTDIDPQESRRRMEQLCERVERLAPAEAACRGELSPAQLLAARWRETLAANTMGAKADPAAERRAQADEVKRAQVEWKRLAPLHGAEGQRLATRFKQACDRFFAKNPSPAAKTPQKPKSRVRSKRSVEPASRQAG